jgi:hypothetical protein
VIFAIEISYDIDPTALATVALAIPDGRHRVVYAASVFVGYV